MILHTYRYHQIYIITLREETQNLQQTITLLQTGTRPASGNIQILFLGVAK
jgi:hypothetical protein